MVESQGISLLAILPEVIFVLGAVAVLMVDVTWKPSLRVHGWIAAVALAGSGVGLVYQWADIQANGPALAYANMIILDFQGVLFKTALVVVTALGLGFAWALMERLQRKAAEAVALVLLSAAGFMFMVGSAHLMLLFLGLEVGSISLYILAGISNETEGSDEAALKYFLLGSAASALFLYGVALFYTATGGMSFVSAIGFFNDLSTRIVFKPAVLPLAVALIFVGLLFKIAAAPFHAWAPDVYQGAPAGITGYMAAAAKIGAIAALARLVQTPFAPMIDTWQAPIAGVAAASMVLGTVYAIVQGDLRRVLAYSGVAHAGFLLVGVAVGLPGAKGLLFYVATYTVVLVASFGVIGHIAGPASSGMPLDRLRGLGKQSPGVAASLTVLMLALSGLPLTTGFIAKFGLFAPAWVVGLKWLVIVGLLASVAAFAFYLRVIVVMYFEDGDAVAPSLRLGTRVSLGAALLITIGLGVYPTPLLELLDRSIF